MTKEEKLSAIYKEMANKELIFGCLVKTNEDKIEMICSGLVNEGTSFSTIPYPEGRWCGFTTIYHLDNLEWINLDSKRTIKEIIGHPVMIGDVLDWIEPYGGVFAQSVNLDIERTRKGTLLLSVRKQKRKPIEDQSDECIDYVYNLIQKY